MRAGIARAKEDHDAAAGEELLKADFATAAYRAAPGEFEKIVEQLRQRADAINVQKLVGIPEHRYVAVNHRLEAGKFAIELEPRVGLDDYSVTVRVGPRPNVRVFSVGVPPVRTSTWEFQATVDDQTDFFWLNTKDGTRWSAERIVSEALDILSDLELSDRASKFLRQQ